MSRTLPTVRSHFHVLLPQDCRGEFDALDVLLRLDLAVEDRLDIVLRPQLLPEGVMARVYEYLRDTKPGESDPYELLGVVVWALFEWKATSV